MKDLAQIVADNERAAERELAEARVDAEQLRLFDRWTMERELRKALPYLAALQVKK